MLQRTGKVFIDKIAGLWYIIYLKRGIYQLLELDIIKAKALLKNIHQILLHITMLSFYVKDVLYFQTLIVEEKIAA